MRRLEGSRMVLDEPLRAERRKSDDVGGCGCSGNSCGLGAEERLRNVLQGAQSEEEELGERLPPGMASPGQKSGRDSVAA